MKTRTDYTCPLELTHDIIRGKWKPIILWELDKASTSFIAYVDDVRFPITKAMLKPREREGIKERIWQEGDEMYYKNIAHLTHCHNPTRIYSFHKYDRNQHR